eukprot:scaffold148764_cov14-Tisochrysis_lutea.AAC.1
MTCGDLNYKYDLTMQHASTSKVQDSLAHRINELTGTGSRGSACFLQKTRKYSNPQNLQPNKHFPAAFKPQRNFSWPHRKIGAKFLAHDSCQERKPCGIH